MTAMSIGNGNNVISILMKAQYNVCEINLIKQMISLISNENYLAISMKENIMMKKMKINIENINGNNINDNENS